MEYGYGPGLSSALHAQSHAKVRLPAIAGEVYPPQLHSARTMPLPGISIRAYRFAKRAACIRAAPGFGCSSGEVLIAASLRTGIPLSGSARPRRAGLRTKSTDDEGR
jgi:hypothetical protein